MRAIWLDSSKRAPKHHTSNWNKRQRKRRPGSSQQPNDNFQRSSQGSQATPSSKPASQSNRNTLPSLSSRHPDESEQRRHKRSERKTKAREGEKLQKWYRMNRKKCNSVNSTPEPTSAQPPAWLPERPSLIASDFDIMYPIASEEIQQQFKRLPNDSSPGPDGIDYRSWKMLSGSSDLLAKLFNICLTNQRIPKDWKSIASNSILTYKKGDRSTPSHWRPICLQNTVYEIYAAILAKRLAAWCMKKKGHFSHAKLSSYLLRDALSTPF